MRVEGRVMDANYSLSNDRRRPLSILLCSSAAAYNWRYWSCDRNPWRTPMVLCDTTSKREPVAISMNRAKSGCDERELPSAMFAEMETAARRIWLVRPNLSASGKFRVREYTTSANSMALCQTSSFSKLNIELCNPPALNLQHSTFTRI